MGDERHSENPGLRRAAEEARNLHHRSQVRAWQRAGLANPDALIEMEETTKQKPKKEKEIK